MHAIFLFFCIFVMALSHRENVVAHVNISVWTFTTMVSDALPQISNPKNGALSLKRLKSHDN